MDAYKTYLPIFQGFYNTIFEPDESNEIDYINSERESLGLKDIDYDDCKFDYTEHNNNTILGCSDYVETILKDIGINNTISNPTLIRPKFYNYSNDSINIDIEININDIKAYLLSNIDAFKDYIKNRYTSYDGFISSYSNDAFYWLSDEIDNNPEHAIASCLEFIICNEIDDPTLDMYYNIQDNYICCTNYTELTTI